MRQCSGHPLTPKAESQLIACSRGCNVDSCGGAHYCLGALPDVLKDNAFELVGWMALALALGGFARCKRLLGRTKALHWARLRAGAWAISSAVALALGVYGLWVRYRPQPAELRATLFPGAEYHRRPIVEPRPVVLHVVSMDLQQPNLHFLLTTGDPGRCIGALETSQFAEKVQAAVAVNTHFFRSCRGAPHPGSMHRGAPVMPLGLSVVEGRKLVTRAWRTSTLYIDEEGHATLGPRPPRVRHAISGRNRLVRNGQVIGAADIFEDDGLAPRVSVGLNEAESQLILLVVDGRQRGYSEGLSLAETAVKMRQLGAFDAIELDGGGSATLVARNPEGRIEVLNSPIHRRLPGRERPVSSHLGMRLD